MNGPSSLTVVVEQTFLIVEEDDLTLTVGESPTILEISYGSGDAYSWLSKALDPATFGSPQDGWIAQFDLATNRWRAVAPAALSTVTWGNVLNTPTTLLGYGITDAYTKGAVDGLLAAVQADADAAQADIDAHEARTDNPHAVTKAQVGLGNVENTALSTWTGSANITTLGTIATGVWNATAIAWAKVDKTGSSLADLATRSAADLSSGVLADARVQQSNVTQHQAALAIAYTQLTYSGLTTGQVLRATAAGAAAFGALDLANVSAVTGQLPWANVDKAGSSLADLATRSAGALNSGNLPYAQLPTGGGSWALGGDLTLSGGKLVVSGQFINSFASDAAGHPAVLGYTASVENVFGNPNTPGAGGNPSANIPVVQLITTAASPFVLAKWGTGVNAGVGLLLTRSKSGTIPNLGAVASGDRLATIAVAGDDGTDQATLAGALRWGVDGSAGTVATNRVPGFLDIMLAPGVADDDLVTTARFNSLGAFRLGASTISAGASLEINRTTGSSSITPVVSRLRSVTSAADWLTGPSNLWGVRDWYSDDASGPGASRRAAIGAFFEDAAATKTGLAIQTSGASGLADVVRLFSDLRTQFRGDVIAGQGELTATPLTGIWRGAAAAGANIAGADVLARSGNGTGSGGSGKYRIQVAGASTYNPARPVFSVAALSVPAAGAQTVRTITIAVPAELVASAMFVEIQSISTSSATSVVSDLSGALTFHDSNANGTNDSVEVWRLVNPAVGTHTITITLPVARRFVANASVWQYVDQTTPLGTAAKATGNTQNATVNITGAVTDMLLDLVAKVDSTETMAAAAGQTEIQNNASTSGTASLNVRGGGSYKNASGGSDTVSWTWAATNRQWAIMVVPIKLDTTATPNLFEDAFVVNNDKMVQFGAYTALGVEALAGFITVKDRAGNTRKLAVIA